MKLRNKISILLLVIWCVMLVVAYLGSQLILSKSYFDLENKEAEDSLQRIHEAVQQTTASVGTMTSSWAVWDDTYNFVQDLNQTFIKTNMNLSSFTASDVDIMLFYNDSGSLVYKMAIDPDRTKVVPVPQELLNYLSPNNKLLYRPSIHEKLQGLVAISSGILLIAEQQILNSNNQGPSHGTILMARYLSPAAIQKIKDVTNINLSISQISNRTLNSKMKSVYDFLKNHHNLIDRNDTNTMTGYSLLRDMNNQPIAIIKAVLNRQVYQFGLKTVKYYNTAFFIYSVVLMALLWYLLQRLLVKRLESLKAQIGNVDETNNSFNNVITGVSDEVSTVVSLYHQATHDPLTGLANRNLLDQAFSSYVSKAETNSSNIALLFLDIDHFKRVNDSLGHEIGDTLLIEVAKKVTSCLRDNDLAVRLGGDEFVVMLVDMDINRIKIVVDRIFNTLSQIVYIQGHEIFLASSMGVSIFPRDGRDISTLLKNADIALYHAKESGRNHYQYYSVELNQAIQEGYKKEAELQRAIDNKELCLFYQPIYDVLTNRLIGLEALIRWRHPERGILSSGEIIPLAEKSGLIHPIGKWVLTNACRNLKSWQLKGLPVVPVSVNISVFQTRNTSIHRLVNDVLTHTELDPHLLELELTETSYVEITPAILDDLRLLRDKGVNLIVDDFGVGSSGLGYLRQLPVSKLKIDQSFIKDACTDSDSSAITLSIIAISHQLDLQVIAEGVETVQQYEFLKANHVDAAQGNYFSPPIDHESCELLLKRSNIKEPSG